MLPTSSTPLPWVAAFLAARERAVAAVDARRAEQAERRVYALKASAIIDGPGVQLLRLPFAARSVVPRVTRIPEPLAGRLMREATRRDVQTRVVLYEAVRDALADVEAEYKRGSVTRALAGTPVQTRYWLPPDLAARLGVRNQPVNDLCRCLDLYLQTKE